jgi:hypothetical protein
MKYLLQALSVCALLLVVPCAVAAQCATGCISSSSCDGTGKGSCKTTCGGDWCGCTDTACQTQVLPAMLAPSTAKLFASTGAAIDSGLLVDCTGSVLDVRFSRVAGEPWFPELPLIRLGVHEARRTRVALSPVALSTGVTVTQADPFGIEGS